LGASCHGRWEWRPLLSRARFVFWWRSSMQFHAYHCFHFGKGNWFTQGINHTSKFPQIPRITPMVWDSRVYFLSATSLMFCLRPWNTIVLISVQFVSPFHSDLLISLPPKVIAWTFANRINTFLPLQYGSEQSKVLTYFLFELGSFPNWSWLFEGLRIDVSVCSWKRLK
jgi:hypothetical protein